MDKRTIIDKIKKLMRLRDGARAVGSESEAQAAAAGIQRLLTSYNLTVEEVEDADLEQDAQLNRYREMGRTDGFDVYDPYRCGWRVELLITLANAYYCRAYRLVGKAQMVVFGTEVNRLSVEYAFNYLAEAFVRLCASRMREQGVKPKQRNSWVSSYLRGCVNGTRERLDKEIQSDERCTALAISHGAMIERYVNQDYNVRTAGHQKDKSVDIDAYLQGLEDGRNQSIAKAIK